jgi:hypothetical protein
MELYLALASTCMLDLAPAAQHTVKYDARRSCCRMYHHLKCSAAYSVLCVFLSCTCFIYMLFSSLNSLAALGAAHPLTVASLHMDARLGTCGTALYLIRIILCYISCVYRSQV